MKHCRIKNLLEKNLDTMILMNGKSDRKLCTQAYIQRFLQFFFSAILDD